MAFAPDGSVTVVPDTPLVTVVIPVFNRERTVVASIESVLRQTYRNTEVVVVDDASTDGSIDAVRRVSDPRVRLIESDTNRGAAGARNLGIAAATGQFVAFQDSDDEWLPTKLERQIALFDPETVAAYCGMAIITSLPSGRTQLRYHPPPRQHETAGRLLDSLLAGSLISTQTLVVPTSVFDRVGLFDESLTPIEDWDLALRLAQEGPIAFVDEPLVIQRFSANSITYDVARRVASQERIVEKYLDDYRRRPRLLARRYYALAGGHRRLGNLETAATFLEKSRRADRSDIRPWFGYLLLALRRIRNLGGSRWTVRHGHRADRAR